ncbi:MAG: Uma2 family endonuclease, partial [Synechococcales bacterium]|nr:Uma2 family endonuclease [Synechococcales bacterium]
MLDSSDGQSVNLLIEYPDTDGEPMTESDPTRHYLVYCVEALRRFFQSRPKVYVSGNLFIYYQEGDVSKQISPDVFVVFGVSKRDRRSYKTWEESGKCPAFILEITSQSTRKKDEVEKPALYAELGVEEYFQFDPTGDYLRPQLKGQRLVNGVYQPIAPNTLIATTGEEITSLHSQTLGLDLRLLPPTLLNPAAFLGLAPARPALRLFDPSTGEPLLTYAESEQARQEAEQERDRAEQARDQAEQARDQAEQAR